jgi:hypothetical protein
MKKIVLSILFFIFFGFVSGALAYDTNGDTFRLPDTDQRKCYEAVSPYSEILCAGTGQDGAYVQNPLSYTDNGNGTVTDNNTGLIWQKEDDGTPRTWEEAGIYCASLGIDWRLPTKKELISIVDYSIPYPGPTINSIFANTKQFGYWSSTTESSDLKGAWVVYFNGGYVGGDPMTGGVYVRCVYGKKLIPSFIDNGNGTVADLRNGLVWQQGEPGRMGWTDALNYCENLELPLGSDQRDWRLPNIKELESITEDTMSDPVNPIAIDRNIFPNAAAEAYWSSTNFPVQPSYAWAVGYDYGRVGPSVKDAYIVSVRCVSGGQVTSSGLFLFPLAGYTYTNVPISAVMDHSMTTPYTKDGVVLAFNGERGDVNKGCWCYTRNSVCNSRNYKRCAVVGFMKDGGGDFLSDILNYNDNYLYYDGHPGYDFAVRATNILAPADGKLYLAKADPVNGNPKKYGTFYIDHQNGYTTWFLHCRALTSSINAQIREKGYADVRQGDPIAISGKKGTGAYHLHFEVRKNGDDDANLVDPYKEGLWK